MCSALQPGWAVTALAAFTTSAACGYKWCACTPPLTELDGGALVRIEWRPRRPRVFTHQRSLSSDPHLRVWGRAVLTWGRLAARRGTRDKWQKDGQGATLSADERKRKEKEKKRLRRAQQNRETSKWRGVGGFQAVNGLFFTDPSGTRRTGVPPALCDGVRQKGCNK